MVAVPSRSIGALLLALTISGFYIPAQPAQLTLQTLYSFTGENGDGALPDGNLTLGPNGVLYGTTIEGGSAAGGIVAFGQRTYYTLLRACTVARMALLRTEVWRLQTTEISTGQRLPAEHIPNTARYLS